MRIALVTDSFVVGGGLEHIYQICRAMPEIEFGVFAKDGNAKEKFGHLPNVKIFSSGYDKKYILSFSPDIVHIHHLRPLIKLYNLDIRTIFTVHGVHLHKYEFISGFKAKMLRFLRLNLERYLYRRIDKLIAVSDDDRAFLKEYYQIDSEVVYNGIDYEPIKQMRLSKEQLRNKFDIQQNSKIYLTVARFDFPKGYDILLQAIALLKQRLVLNDSMLFLLAGDGQLFDEMKQYAKRLGIYDNLRFLGRRDDVYALMATSDICILPSRWEGLPITMIEALASRLPIIASDTYGNRMMEKFYPQNIHLFVNESAQSLAESIQHGEFDTASEIDLSRFESYHFKQQMNEIYLEFAQCPSPK